MEVEKENEKMGFMETELRLGLPGNNQNDGESRKRGYCETVDLKLKFEESDMEKKQQNVVPKDKNLFSAVDPAKPPATKAQVVGWPPVRSYRKNVMLGGVEKSKNSEESEKGSFVKVSMDGAPYLRKVDLNMYKGYRELSHALSNMFSSFTIGNCGGQGMKDFLNETSGIDYVPTYEDKDGDWMLVGDVPWEMFVQSCKRLRIMKGTEATGLAPRAMEKRKNKS